jgi:hypothetical protein
MLRIAIPFLSSRILHNPTPKIHLSNLPLLNSPPSAFQRDNSAHVRLPLTPTQPTYQTQVGGADFLVNSSFFYKFPLYPQTECDGLNGVKSHRHVSPLTPSNSVLIWSCNSFNCLEKGLYSVYYPHLCLFLSAEIYVGKIPKWEEPSSHFGMEFEMGSGRKAWFECEIGTATEKDCCSRLLNRFLVALRCFPKNAECNALD